MSNVKRYIAYLNDRKGFHLTRSVSEQELFSEIRVLCPPKLDLLGEASPTLNPPRMEIIKFVRDSDITERIKGRVYCASFKEIY